MPIQLQCIKCGTIVIRKPSMVYEKTYCSRQCQGKDHGRRLADQNIAKAFKRRPDLVQPQEHRLVPLNKGAVVLVDTADYEAVMKFPWRLHDFGYATNDGHPRRMHRLVMERKLGRELGKYEQVDHINHDRLDNRRSNLRIASNQQNGFNKRPIPGTSAFKGVCWVTQKQRWCASITIRNQRVHCGFFTDEVEAAYRYDQFALELFGEYAYLNLIGD